MPGYRIYEIGQDGHVVRLLAELTLDNDVTAIAYAEQLPRVEAFEIWEGKPLDSRTKCNRAMRTGFARLCQAL